MKHPSGGFRMHDAGEIDVRACYTAISVASILNILDDELVQNVGSYILSCQTYVGGISGEPGSEAHGGYTFCGVATMILINEVNRLDLPRLIGGVFALLQRVCSIVDEQFVLPDAGGHCTKDSPHTSAASSIAEVGKSFEGASSQVDETPHSRQGVNFNDIGYTLIKRRVGSHFFTS